MRVHHVKKARKDQGVCEACRDPIGIGEGYKYVSPRYGPKRKRHAGCRTWRPSELTSSKMATAYAAVEEAEDRLNDVGVDPHEDTGAFRDEVREAVYAAAEGIREAAEDYRDGYENMPENFQNGPTGEDILEKADYLDEKADELESWEPSDAPERSDYEADDDGHDEWTDAVDGWADDVRGDAMDALALDY